MNTHTYEISSRDGASGYLTIDLRAIEHNYRLLQQRTSPVPVAAVVKADAYGLDAGRVAPVLYDAGCRDFFVAHFGEAVRLKTFVEPDARIFVLNGLQPGAEGRCADLGIIPVLNSLEQLENWSRTAVSRGDALPAVLQVDSGMSRLGLPPEESATLAGDHALLEGVDLLYLMSHLASADENASQQNGEQLAALRHAAALFPELPLCFANSGGIFLGRDFQGALARPGIALYGGLPTDVPGIAVKPVARLDVRVVQTRTVPAGSRVGYGGAHVTRTETRLATIAAGYADGLPRSLSDRGAAYYGGVRLPIVGRVSMDSMTIDISALPPGTLKLGSLVEMIGPHQPLEAIAADACTISYEILTSLGNRYHREYR
ncbi:alanine racemase [Rhizobium subbaraonis]|uniref:Alanine racemase n=1 Tax=Rhizobium subbaraonis TaxID=908946 RepID=A0A285UMS1_9HYPH|nr:alanine racemase [Rhizobium subbaraonis]SOC42997.1 alanine racemase [Rhizobium subbaraonis]